MKDALIQLSKGVHKGPASDLIPVLFGERQPTVSKKDVAFTSINKNLDHSQVCYIISFLVCILKSRFSEGYRIIIVLHFHTALVLLICKYFIIIKASTGLFLNL